MEGQFNSCNHGLFDPYLDSRLVDNTKALVVTDSYRQNKSNHKLIFLMAFHHPIEINVPYAKICRVVLRAIVSTAVECEPVMIVMMLVVTSTGAVLNDCEYVCRYIYGTHI